MIMSNGLSLAVQQPFGNTVCDFWRKDSSDNSEVWMTREQIGSALEYEDPNKSIDKIHQRHKGRLDRFSTTVTLGQTEGSRYVNREMMLYSQKGVYEICRWSRKPKADAFMDFAWDVIEGLRTNRLQITQRDNTDLHTIKTTMLSLRQENAELKRELRSISTKLNRVAPPARKSAWKNTVTARLSILEGRLDLVGSKVLSGIYREIGFRHGVDLTEYQREFEVEFQCQRPPIIDVIDHNDELKGYFEEIFAETISHYKDAYLQLQEGQENYEESEAV